MSKEKAAKVAISVDASDTKGPMRIERYGLGQGGLSQRPMIDRHIDQLRWLNPATIRLFVQEYFDVYPAHGKYNWAKLDRAVDAIMETGAKPLMSICIKPAPLYGDIHDQDKSLPSDWDEWEALISAMVRHYNVERRDGIEYWEVFNEPDIGESGGCPCRFTPEDYCTYYEHTVRAVRRADATAKVGGPALAYYKSPLLPALLAHCSDNDVPLDFVSWHYYTSDPQVVRKSIEDVKALLAEYPALDCETVFDEWNMSLGWETTEKEFQPCFVLESTYQMIEAGLDMSCYYHIRDWHVSRDEFAPFMSHDGATFMTYWWNINPQFHGLFDFQGTMRPAYFAFRMMTLLTGDRVEVKSNSRNVKALAAYDPLYGALHVVAWSFGLDAPPAATLEIAVENLPSEKWEVRRRMLDAGTPSNLENDRLQLVENRVFEGDSTKVEFDLAPYGAALIAVRKL